MWEVITTDTFDEWFDSLNDSERANVIAGMLLLQNKGPHLSRPYADTVYGSKFTNMKELRVQSNGDPLRAFFLLSILSVKVFYYVLVTKAVMKNVFTNR